MSYNGVGTFVINTPGQPVVTNTVISSTAFNLLTGDLATGLSTALTKDGQTTPIANIPMGGFKIIDLAPGVALTDAASIANLQDNTGSAATATGTDTYAITPVPPAVSYVTGQTWTVTFTNANTGPATLNVSGLGPKAITKNGAIALVGGDIQAGSIWNLTYDGTRFVLNGQAGALAIGNGGTQVTAFTAAVNTRYNCVFGTSGTITGPAAATVGDLMILSLAGFYVYTFNPNGLKINSSTSNLPLVGNQTLTLEYSGATDGWV